MTLTDNERKFLSAVEDGDLERIKSMATSGLISLVNHDRIRDPRRRTALVLASRGGHLDIMKFLIDKGANVNQRGPKGMTPLHYASCKGYSGAVKLLIDKGANANQVDKDGMTPLLYVFSHHCKIREGHADVVKLLIDNGANVNQQDRNGMTFLHLANKYGKTDAVKLLMTTLLYASREGHVDAVKLLIDNGTDVNQQDKDGMTSLLYASREGHANVVKLLIANGANVNQQDQDGKTPLLHATGRGHTNVIKLSIANGANVNQQDQDGMTPLLYALDRKYYRYVDMVELLLEMGADPHIKDKYNRTALDSARHCRYYQVIKRHIQRLQQQIQDLLRCNDRLPIAVWPNALSRLNSVNFIFPLLCEIPFLFKQTARRKKKRKKKRIESQHFLPRIIPVRANPERGNACIGRQNLSCNLT